MSTPRTAPKVVPGRRCGSCSLCCKVMQVDEFDKPQGVWCRHCRPGRGGCTIHQSRPPVCRNYHCGWLLSSSLGPEWQPSVCKMLINFETDRMRVSVHVDPGDPTAWKRDPYYTQFKDWSRQFVDKKQFLIVYIKRRAIVVLPDKEIDLGTIEPGEDVQFVSRMTPGGRTWDATKIVSKANV